MEREEPSTCLVNTLGNEVGRVSDALVNQILIFEWIVYLSIRHGT